MGIFNNSKNYNYLLLVAPVDNTRVSTVDVLRTPLRQPKPQPLKAIKLVDGKPKPVDKPKYQNDLYGRSFYLMEYLTGKGYTPELAAAISGTLADENGIRPDSFMQAEKDNKGVPLTRNGGYGAGIGSWTGVDYKNQLLSYIGKPAGTPIESLSFDDLLAMLYADQNNGSKRYYDALRRTNNLEDAAATSFIITGGVGHSKNWSTHPTPAEARELAEIYGRSNDRLFGYSPYHHGSFDRRYEKSLDLLSNYYFKKDSIALALKADSLARLDMPLFFKFNNPK